MTSTLFYLFTHRTKYPMLSAAWIKCWIKRSVNLPELILLIMAKTYFRLGGVHLGLVSDISRGVDIQGQWRYLRLGDGSFVGRAKIMLHDKLTIGNNVVINDDVRLITGSHDVGSSTFRSISAPITIEDYCWICTGSTILPGVHIGYGAVIGACSLVSKNVPPMTVVAGNPAISIKDRKVDGLHYSPNLLRACYECWIAEDSLLSLTP